MPNSNKIPFQHLYFNRPNELAFKLGSMLISAGHEEITHSTPYSWDGMKRGREPIFIWQYTLRGFGALRYNGKTYDVMPGQAMLLTVPEEHCYWHPAESESWEFIHVTVGGDEMIRLGNEARNTLGVLARHSQQSSVVQNAISLISSQSKHWQRTPFELSKIAFTFMMDLLAEIKSLPRSRDDILIEQAREYCLSNISKSLTVEDLARVTQLSRSHFSRHFLRITGLTPHHYILETKMGLAANLLRQTALSIKEVAHACGYQDTSYFSKIFKTYHGSPPSEFRSPMPL